MYENLVRAILIATFSGLGFSLFELPVHDPVRLAILMARKPRQIAKIDWKPFSVFPGEAKRFRKKGKIEM